MVGAANMLVTAALLDDLQHLFRVEGPGFGDDVGAGLAHVGQGI